MLLAIQSIIEHRATAVADAGQVTGQASCNRAQATLATTTTSQRELGAVGYPGRSTKKPKSAEIAKIADVSSIFAAGSG